MREKELERGGKEGRKEGEREGRREGRERKREEGGREQGREQGREGRRRRRRRRREVHTSSVYIMFGTVEDTGTVAVGVDFGGAVIERTGGDAAGAASEGSVLERTGRLDSLSKRRLRIYLERNLKILHTRNDLPRPLTAPGRGLCLEEMNPPTPLFQHPFLTWIQLIFNSCGGRACHMQQDNNFINKNDYSDN